MGDSDQYVAATLENTDNIAFSPALSHYKRMTQLTSRIESRPAVTEPEQVRLPRWFTRGTLTGSLLFMSGLVVGIETTHVDADQFIPESAHGLAFDLSESDHVAEAARVKVGYEIPLTNSPVEGAVAIYNPIDLGDHTYGYIAPETNSDEVVIGTVEYHGPLHPARIGDHYAANSHDVISPLALVYNEYTRLDNGDPARNYRVIMGEQSGNTYGLTTAQLDEIAQSSVGELVYAGK